MGWFRERRRQKRFNKAWKRVSKKEFEKGNITEEEFAKCERASADPEVMKKLREKSKSDPKLKGGIKDWDWDAILKWVEEFFIPLLRALLPLLLVLDEKPEDPR